MAGIGHNSRAFGEDEYVPPKAERVVNRDRAEALLLSARMISTLYKTPKNRILEKRKGGEDGRALRRFLILYARGLGSPVWECAEIFDLNRKQIGQEEASYLDMLARNPDLETDAENMISMLDYALKVDRARFIRVSLTEIAAETAMRKAIKTARESADMIEANAPKSGARVPKPKPVSAEVERIQAEANARHAADARKRAEKILLAVIQKGAADNATKEQKSDARKALAALKELEQSAKRSKVKG